MEGNSFDNDSLASSTDVGIKLPTTRTASPLPMLESPHTVFIHSTTQKFVEAKKMDNFMAETISRMISSAKLDPREAVLRFDVANAKSKLEEWAKTLKLPKTSLLIGKIVDVYNHLDYGYKLLKPNKLIPLTRLESLINLGVHVKPENRVQSVKQANKKITNDHKLFGNVYQLLVTLKELMLYADKEKFGTLRRMNTKKDEREQKLETRRGNFVTWNEEEKVYLAEINDLKKLIDEVRAVARLANALYEYYSKYIMQFVEEFGEASYYKSRFSETNAYLLALAKLVGSRQPLFACEKEGLRGDKDKDKGSLLGDSQSGGGESSDFSCPLTILNSLHLHRDEHRRERVPGTVLNHTVCIPYVYRVYTV